MRYLPDTSRYRGSATDLANHARCPHLTQLARDHARAVAEGRAEPIVATGPMLAKGQEHEQEWISRRRREVEVAGGRFVDVVAGAGDDLRLQRDLLAAAMRDGIELVAQAPLVAGTLFGYADLLERTDDAPEAGGTVRTRHRYEPLEIKLARTVRPEHLLQVSAYADALERLQGDAPAQLHVVTGTGARGSFRTSEYVEYFRAARERFEAALGSELAVELERLPEPVAHCALCSFKPTCDARWTAADHLSRVANIRTDQRAKLAAVGVTTLTELADLELDRVPGIGRSTLARLVLQAHLQLESRDGDAAQARVAFRTPAPDEEPGRGFALLPDPDPEDMFFDFEGYPYHPSGALEYLWGWTSARPGGSTTFDHLWADDPCAEAAAFTAFLDEVHARRRRSPGMHVFHYAPYEVTALRRLAKQHPQEMGRLDTLLRAGVFVDLFAVVRQAIQVGRPSYSIKQLEPLYGVSRSGDDLADGGASIEVYETWLLEQDEQVRQSIIDYNRVDCDSTLALRDWLLDQRDRARDAGIEWPTTPPAPDAEDDAGTDSEDEAPASPARDLVERLELLADDVTRPDDVRRAARLLSAMPGWGWRSRREFFGDLYARRRDRDVEDYVDEPTAVAGLVLLDEEPKAQGTVLRRYSFPDQVTLVKAGQTALDPMHVTTIGIVESIDLDANELVVRTRGSHLRKLEEAGNHPVTPVVVGWTEIPVLQLEQAAARVAEQLLAAIDLDRDPFASDWAGAAALSMLARRPTATVDGPGYDAIDDPPDPAAIADLVRRAPGSHVIVQGPPGTGKTYTSARLIAELVAAGLRVGISSNSHDAVINVLAGLQDLRDERLSEGRPFDLRAAYPLRKGSGERAPGDLRFGSGWIERTSTSKDARALLEQGEVQVLAGTAWLFSGETPIDVVLVDEAGQVSLLHATAMASRARSVVLVGDPQQLPQPSDAAHPEGCGASVLEHLFGDAPVLPRDRALLLPVTRRMHPDVTEFVSSTYYRGELQAHPETASQYVRIDGLPHAGTHLVEVTHHGNRVRSEQEVEAIARLVERLLGSGRVVAAPGEAEREVRPEDLIVVAPYNAQRRLLQATLGEQVRVGTVDRFQGLEAPIAIVSMTASSRDELPRGLEFLLDPHRLNVAISRARALAIMVASPTLLATTATSLHEMRLLNDVARFAARSRRR